ncbi:MAG: FtsX-like permease family protein [Ruminococcus sp.]|nr:FtsX-like permease family protein [Ruminococcus sp.]
MVKLLKANLRKDKAMLFIFMLIVILSTFRIHSALLASDYRQIYQRKADRTNIADYVIFTVSEREALDGVFDGFDFITDYRPSDVILLSSFSYITSKDPDEKIASSWIIQNAAEDNGFSDLKFIERDDSVSGHRIYLNLHTAYSNNLCTGDTVTIDTRLGKYEFTVAGIYEHLYMGHTYTYKSAMIDPDIFGEMTSERERLSEEAADLSWRTMYDIHIREGYDPEQCLMDTKETLSGEYNEFCEGITAKEMADGYPSIVNIIAAFMGTYAVLAMVICLVIIVFTVNNNISRDVRTIGALKAVGHTVGQIRAAMTVEYLLLGLTGTLIGIVLSYTLNPVIDYLTIRIVTGITWEKRFYPAVSFGLLLAVIAAIVLTAFLSTIRIRSLHPSTALRFGFQSNSFKKNHLPLSETRGELNYLLALKNTLQNKAQNVIIFFIVLCVSFVTMFSGILYYNTKADISVFQRMIDGDVADAYFYVSDTSSEGVEKTIEKLKNVDGVSQAYGLSYTFCYIGDKETNLVYTTDPSCLNCGLYDGVMLEEENEAVLGITLAEDIGAGVGDEVEVTFGNNSIRLLVTGLQQSALNNRIYVDQKAAEKLGVILNYENIRVRVRDADDKRVDEVLKAGKELCGSIITDTENIYRFQHSNENTPFFAVSFVVMILIALNILIVFLVIWLLLRTVFVKREKEFGIKKAVGFTSTQLRYQLSLSLLPPTLLGAVSGAVAGYFLTNPLFALVLSSYGIRRSDLILKPELIAIPIVSVTAIVFLFSFVMSGRMKRLSAYKLIQE